jgi:murein L,D-transpeptidase YafK
VLRRLLALTAIAATMALAACDRGPTPGASERHLQPVSEQMLAELEGKRMSKGSPILLRVFKEESELEVWKQDDSGRFALLRTYPICRWSGGLGPKIKEGDRQAPEGFYPLGPGQMNPNSSNYLAINTGFPNAYDRANGRTGAFLMIHGDCASVGCYAMTDEQIAEIYALAREAFFAGQKSVQLQAFPFRMTPLNMARHRDSPHMAFWRMLKQGYDRFEVTHLEPKVNVCERRYVFDAETTTQFSPADQCPAYTVPADIAAVVGEKERRDDVMTAELIRRGTPTVPIMTNGGMHPIFLAAVKRNGGPGAPIRTAAGTIPARASPPDEPVETTTAAVDPDTVEPMPEPEVASADSSAPVGSFVRSLPGSQGEPPAPITRNELPPVQASASNGFAPYSKSAAAAAPAYPAATAPGTIRSGPQPARVPPAYAPPAHANAANALPPKQVGAPPPRPPAAVGQQSMRERTPAPATTAFLSGAPPATPSR